MVTSPMVPSVASPSDAPTTSGYRRAMKHTGENAAPGQNVPRDSDTADAEASDRRHVPGADDRNAPDEDAARPGKEGVTGKPIPPRGNLPS
jgi:hypothetical protein